MDEFIVRRTSGDFKDKGLSEYEAFINCSIDDVINSKICNGYLDIYQNEGKDPIFISIDHDGNSSFEIRIINTYDRMDIEEKYEVEYYYSPEGQGLEDLWNVSKPIGKEMVDDLLDKFGNQYDNEEDDYDM